MLNTPNPPISVSVTFPAGMTPCPGCGLHYVMHGHVDRRRCLHLQGLVS